MQAHGIYIYIYTHVYAGRKKNCNMGLGGICFIGHQQELSRTFRFPDRLGQGEGLAGNKKINNQTEEREKKRGRDLVCVCTFVLLLSCVSVCVLHAQVGRSQPHRTAWPHVPVCVYLGKYVVWHVCVCECVDVLIYVCTHVHGPWT